MDIKISPAVWMNLTGSDDRDYIDSSRRSLNHIFKSNDAAIPLGETYEEITGEGDNVFKLVFYCRENPDITVPLSPTQRVMTTLSDIFTHVGFPVEIDEYGMKVTIQDMQEDILKFRDLASKIEDAARAQQALMNFTPESL